MAKEKAAPVAQKTEQTSEQATATQNLNAASPAAAVTVTRETLLSVLTAAKKALRDYEDANPDADPLAKELQELDIAKMKATQNLKKFDAEIAAAELAKVNAERVKFADECKSVLFAHFNGAVLNEKEQGDLRARIDSVMTVIAPPKATGSTLSTATAGSTSGSGKTAEIIAAYTSGIASGRTEKDIRKELIAQGYNDGTVGNAIVNYKRANGLMS